MYWVEVLLTEVSVKLFKKGKPFSGSLSFWSHSWHPPTFSSASFCYLDSKAWPQRTLYNVCIFDIHLTGNGCVNLLSGKSQFFVPRVSKYQTYVFLFKKGGLCNMEIHSRWSIIQNGFLRDYFFFLFLTHSMFSDLIPEEYEHVGAGNRCSKKRVLWTSQFAALWLNTTTWVCVCGYMLKEQGSSEPCLVSVHWILDAVLSKSIWPWNI